MHVAALKTPEQEKPQSRLARRAQSPSFQRLANFDQMGPEMQSWGRLQGRCVVPGRGRKHKEAVCLVYQRAHKQAMKHSAKIEVEEPFKN